MGRFHIDPGIGRWAVRKRVYDTRAEAAQAANE